MYLSQLLLNPRSAMAQRELASPYQMHRTILSAFPSADSGGPGRVLFRVEPEQADLGVRVLVQSAQRPAWDAVLAAHPGYLIAPPAVKEVCPMLPVGRPLRFRLRANATYRRDGKRLGHMTEERQRQWLWRKAEAGGFRILGVLVRPEGMVRDRARPGEPPFSWLSVLFDGVLEITDGARAHATLAQGIGSGKGMGFGLLSLAPVTALR